MTLARRTLFTALGGLGAAALTEAAPARIIDTHTHFYDPRRPEGIPWPPKDHALLYRPTLPEHFRFVTKPLGVTGTVVVEASPWVEDNQWLLDLAERETVIVGIVGRLDPAAADFPRLLERFGRYRLFRGIRLGSNQVDAGLARPDYVENLRRLAAADLELDLIGQPEMYATARALSDRVPELRIVLNHLPLDWPAGDASVRQAFADLRPRKQIYAKVSGVPRRVDGRVPAGLAAYREPLEELWANFGPRRLIYGSNWPVSDRLAAYSVALRIVRQFFAGKGAAALDLFFWKNARAAYRWIDR